MFHLISSLLLSISAQISGGSAARKSGSIISEALGGALLTGLAGGCYLYTIAALNIYMRLSTPGKGGIAPAAGCYA